MSNVRPCLACGRECGVASATCEACGQPLSAWSSAAVPRRLSTESPGRALGRAALVVLALGVAAALAWLLWPTGRESGAATAGWSRPETVAAWAEGRLARHDAPAYDVQAVVDEGPDRSRRVLRSAHPPESEPRELARAAARVLLEAREAGERLLTHVAVVEHGPVEARRAFAVPVAEAARVLEDEETLAARLGEAVLITAAPPEPPDDDANPEEPEPVEDEDRPPDPDGVDEPSARRSMPAPRSERAEARAPAPPAGSPPRVGRRPSRGGRPADEDPVPAVRVLGGPLGKVRHVYPPGSTGVGLLSVLVGPIQPRPLILRRLVARSRGTLNEVDDVDFVYLVHDVNRNGRRDEPDRQLGEPQAFVDPDGEVAFERLDFAFGADGQTVNLLVVVDFLDGVVGGDLFLHVSEPDDVLIEEVASGRPCPVSGLPLNGKRTSLDGDIEPDPFEAELDALAFEEP